MTRHQYHCLYVWAREAALYESVGEVYMKMAVYLSISREEARSRGFCVIMDGGHMLEFFQTTIIKALNQLQVGHWRTEETIDFVTMLKS